MPSKNKGSRKRGKSSSSSSSSSMSSRSSSSSSSSQSKSRSRSRSKDKKRTQNKKGSTKESTRNKKSNSSDRSSPSSYARKASDKDRKDDKYNDSKTQSEQSLDPQRSRPRIKASINNFALAGMLFDNKKTNERLDREELDRANEQFKKIDRSERRSILMSSHINQKHDVRRDEYTMEYVNGEYVKVLKPFVCEYKNCGMRFRFSTEINEHLEVHKREESFWNKKKGDDLTTKFFSK